MGEVIPFGPHHERRSQEAWSKLQQLIEYVCEDVLETAHPGVTLKWLAAPSPDEIALTIDTPNLDLSPAQRGEILDELMQVVATYVLANETQRYQLMKTEDRLRISRVNLPADESITTLPTKDDPEA